MAIVRRSRNPQMRAMMALAPSLGKVIVVRHGSTDRNRGGVGMDQVRGHADIPMTVAGEVEVYVTARIVAAERISLVHTSDLQRATVTAHILADENAGYPPVVVDPALRSWDMGAAMEGQVTTPDVVAQIVAWVKNDTTVPAGGESFRAFAARLLAYVQGVFDAALAGGDTVAIVAHGRCVQVIDFWVAAGCDEVCMHREFAEYLADEPDTVPPGGGIRYRHDGLGWVGQVIPTGALSTGSMIVDGARIRPANEMAMKSGGIAS